MHPEDAGDKGTLQAQQRWGGSTGRGLPSPDPPPALPPFQPSPASRGKSSIVFAHQLSLSILEADSIEIGCLAFCPIFRSPGLTISGRTGSGRPWPAQIRSALARRYCGGVAVPVGATGVTLMSSPGSFSVLPKRSTRREPIACRPSGTTTGFSTVPPHALAQPGRPAKNPAQDGDVAHNGVHRLQRREQHVDVDPLGGVIDVALRNDLEAGRVQAGLAETGSAGR